MRNNLYNNLISRTSRQPSSGKAPRATRLTGDTISLLVANEFQQRVGDVQDNLLVFSLLLVQAVLHRVGEVVDAGTQDVALVAIILKHYVQVAGRLVLLHLRLEFRDVDERLKALHHLHLGSLGVFERAGSAVPRALLLKEILRLLDGQRRRVQVFQLGDVADHPANLLQDFVGGRFALLRKRRCNET